MSRGNSIQARSIANKFQSPPSGKKQTEQVNGDNFLFQLFYSLRPVGASAFCGCHSLSSLPPPPPLPSTFPYALWEEWAGLFSCLSGTAHPGTLICMNQPATSLPMGFYFIYSKKDFTRSIYNFYLFFYFIIIIFYIQLESQNLLWKVTAPSFPDGGVVRADTEEPGPCSPCPSLSTAPLPGCHQCALLAWLGHRRGWR